GGYRFMKRRSLMICLALLLALSTLLSACGPKAPAQGDVTEPEPAAAEKSISILMESEPPNIDPQIGTDLYSFFVAGHVLEGLVRVYDGKVIPGVAEKWDISPDGLTYTFHLRDSKWSDGVPVKAQDFEYSILRLLDPKTAASYAEVMGFYIKNAAKYYSGEITDKAQVGVKAADDKTLIITLENPTGYFIRLLGFVCFLPTREDLVAKHGEAYAAEPDKMVYNGPYIVKEWKHEESVTLAKNPDFWNAEQVKMDLIECPIITDRKTAINMYEAGELDYSLIPTEMIDSYIQNGEAQMMPNGGLYWLQFNFNSKSNGNILKNTNFRKAISYAIDRDSLVKAIIKKGYPASRYVPDNIMGMNDRFAVENPLQSLPIKADPAKAKEYFDAALKELNMTADKFPTIKLLCADTEEPRKYCEAVQDMLLNTLGVKIEITSVPSKQRLEAVKARDYEIVYANWFPDYDDPMTYLDIWITGGGFNRSDYSNPAYDKLISEAKAATDEKVRQQKMLEAEKLALEDMIVVPAYWGANAGVQSDRMIGFVRSMVGADPDLTFVDITE
ncbi:MAG TPA: peptide ABC transporter substrate-binding protein, partial [Clostridia bacterium]|nr:peptide ABC transporter substrate-binding protein [Clostridia bacterium]